MVQTKIIDNCYKNCIFFGKNMEGMECRHPYFDTQPSYSGMIITSENVRIGEIPEECPLRKEEVTVIYKINL
jgi:hypothetical protein